MVPMSLFPIKKASYRGEKMEEDMFPAVTLHKTNSPESHSC